MQPPSLTLIKTREDIENAIKTLCSRLAEDRVVSDYTALVLLEGADKFFNTLTEQLETAHGLRFKNIVKVRLTSYHDTSSTGKVNGLENIPLDQLEGNIMIIDDILDTGCTLRHVLNIIRQNRPSENRGHVLSCILFNKDTPSDRPETDYYGMTVPDYFVVGYGLDHNGAHRELDELYIKE